MPNPASSLRPPPPPLSNHPLSSFGGCAQAPTIPGIFRAFCISASPQYVTPNQARCLKRSRWPRISWHRPGTRPGPTGGDSVYKFLHGDQARFFDDEIHPELRHSKIGTVAMASAGKNRNAAQFYITLRDDVEYLDDKHTVFGIVAEGEGLDTLTKINESYVDGDGRPFKDIRIKHTCVLYDPDDDPAQLAELIPANSPVGKPIEEISEESLEDTWVPLDETVDPVQLEGMIR
ncbi:hypothetical protein ZWY2020_059458 [Hordeum vulgare]|nr:hypothetical protein ZWY2020_059458 [Hordeum vulgare]